MKTLIAAFAALFLVGCANTPYYEALRERAKADGLIQVAKHEADAEKWKALAKASDTDTGRFALGLVAAVSEVKGSEARPNQSADAIRPPKDALDYFAALTSSIAGLGNVYATIENIRAYKQVRTAEINSTVAIESARQSGETNRVTAVGNSNLQLATSITTALRPLPGQPTSVTNTTITAGGNINTGTTSATSNTTNSSTTNTTTTTTARNCGGGTAAGSGNGAPAGSGSSGTTGAGTGGASGQTGQGGSANGGTC